MEKNWKYAFFSFDVVNIFSIGIITLLLATLNTRFNVGGNIISILNSNWNNTYITDIQVSDSITCPDSFLPVLLDTFPGTIEGCDCTNGTRTMNDIVKYSCSDKNSPISMKHNCTYINMIKETDLYFWKSKVLCSKYSSSRYLNLTIIQSNETCSEKMKSCGRIDTISDNQLCIPEEDLCPVKDIIFVKKSEATPLNYDKLNYNTDFDIIFSRKNEIPAISNFKISEGLNCIDPTQKNSFGTPYILMVNYYNYPCTTIINNTSFDFRYQNLSNEIIQTRKSKIEIF